MVFESIGVVNEYIGGYDDWLRQRLARADFYQQGKNQMGEAQNRFAALNKELAAVYARWEALDAQGS